MFHPSIHPSISFSCLLTWCVWEVGSTGMGGPVAYSILIAVHAFVQFTDCEFESQIHPDYDPWSVHIIPCLWVPPQMQTSYYKKSVLLLNPIFLAHCRIYSVAGSCLQEAGETYKHLAEIKYNLEDNVKQNFLEPLALLQTKDLKEVNVSISQAHVYTRLSCQIMC